MKLKDLRKKEGEILNLANSEIIKILKVVKESKILIEFQSKRKCEIETSHTRIKEGNIVNPYSDIHRNSFNGVMGLPRKFVKKEKDVWNNIGMASKKKGKNIREEFSVFEDFLKILEKKQNYKQWLSTSNQYKIISNEDDFEIVPVETRKRVYVKNIWTGNVEVYNTVQECADEFGLNIKTIRKRCNENRIVDGEQFSFYK